jgi:SAM-dependent methyltransferase
LPTAGAAVLEVGCGEGDLARAMAARGYRVTAIDPEAPEGDVFRRVTLEEFHADRPFEAVVAVLSLHHIESVSDAVSKMRELLQDRGLFIAVEFAWEHIDDATARWCLQNLREVHDGEEGWLHRRFSEWRERAPEVSPHEYFRSWAETERMHTSRAMLEELRANLTERHFEWSPYLYPDLDGISREDEIKAIESGEIRATGFRFVGERT